MGREQPLSFSVNLRITPNKDFGPFFATLKNANFNSVNIGLESGSPKVRSEILKRHYSNQDVLKAVRTAKENGLRVSLYVLEGLPGETWEDFQETVQCTRDCEPDFYYLSIFTPYPGTALYDKCLEMNLIGDKLNMQLERRRPVLNLPGFSPQQIKREYLLFAYKVYKGKWSLLAIAKKTLGTWIRTSILLNIAYKQMMRIPQFQNFRRRAGWQW
jgi:radical SAM superfamily enzyme YgiQ (UPF0313 family)